jgi:hypothetical protein
LAALAALAGAAGAADTPRASPARARIRESFFIKVISCEVD